MSDDYTPTSRDIPDFEDPAPDVARPTDGSDAQPGRYKVRTEEGWNMTLAVPEEADDPAWLTVNTPAMTTGENSFSSTAVPVPIHDRDHARNLAYFLGRYGQFVPKSDD